MAFISPGAAPAPGRSPSSALPPRWPQPRLTHPPPGRRPGPHSSRGWEDPAGRPGGDRALGPVPAGGRGGPAPTGPRHRTRVCQWRRRTLRLLSVPVSSHRSLPCISLLVQSPQMVMSLFQEASVNPLCVLPHGFSAGDHGPTAASPGEGMEGNSRAPTASASPQQVHFFSDSL